MITFTIIKKTFWQEVMYKPWNCNNAQYVTKLWQPNTYTQAYTDIVWYFLFLSEGDTKSRNQLKSYFRTLKKQTRLGTVSKKS